MSGENEVHLGEVTVFGRISERDLDAHLFDRPRLILRVELVPSSSEEVEHLLIRWHHLLVCELLHFFAADTIGLGISLLLLTHLRQVHLVRTPTVELKVNEDRGRGHWSGECWLPNELFLGPSLAYPTVLHRTKTTACGLL